LQGVAAAVGDLDCRQAYFPAIGEQQRTPVADACNGSLSNVRKLAGFLRLCAEDEDCRIRGRQNHKICRELKGLHQLS
jgi:hypothetical protein